MENLTLNQLDDVNGGAESVAHKITETTLMIGATALFIGTGGGVGAAVALVGLGFDIAFSK